MASRNRGQALSSALLRYRVMAYATGCLLLLLTLHIVIQLFQAGSTDLPVFQNQGLAKFVPGADHWVPLMHGWLYLIYVIVAVDLWLRTRLSAWRMILVVLAGTIPFASFFAEHWVTSRLRPMIAAVVRREQPGTGPAADAGAVQG